MFFSDPELKLDQDITKNDLTLQQLMIRIDSLDREIKSLTTELNISPEKISTFIENKENFTEENWQDLIKQRQHLDEKLNTDLSNIRDPRKIKKTHEDRNIQRHWLFVR
jgi:hypothetical protein